MSSNAPKQPTSTDADRRVVNLDGADPAAAPRHRGVYLLPNLITTAALFAGFYAIIAGMNGHYIAAVLAVYAAVALDTADGRVARYTGTESEFGAVYDSLADMIAFGAAPALVAFSFALGDLGRVGWVAAFVYMAAAALRLARFSVSGSVEYFAGLASPAAAVILTSLVWVLVELPQLASGTVAALVATTTVVSGLLMIAPVRYFSPKQIALRDRVPFIGFVGIVLVFALAFLDPPRVLLVIATGYAISGPLTMLWKMRSAGNSGA
ncbi:MAG: phosphatidylcholine/phosphatidylserine synthase [Pseudomonadota bacterium]